MAALLTRLHPLLHRRFAPAATTAAVTGSSLARPLSSSCALLLAHSPARLAPVQKLGSGSGGKADKAATAKAKLKALKDKEKARATAIKEKERERVKKLKEKAKEKEKEKKDKAKLREKEKKEKLKEKAQAAKATAKSKRATKSRTKKSSVKKPAPKKPSTRSSLHPPKLPRNAWTLFLQDYVQQHTAALVPGQTKPSMTQYAKLAATEYKDLSASEKADLLTRVQELKDAYPAKYEAWLDSLTPEMIQAENSVRLRRRRQGLSSKKPLKLEGEPKKAASSFILFGKAVRAGQRGDILGDETNILKQSRLIADAWRALSADEKLEFDEAAKLDKERYIKEKDAFDALQKSKQAAKEIVDP